MKSKPTVLVTAAGGNLGRSMAYYLAKKGMRIIAVDANPEFLCAAPSEKRYLLPPVSNAAYLKALNAIIKKENVDTIFFMSDAEIRFASQKRTKINASVWLPAHDTVTLMQDKFACNQLWSKHGVPVPKSHIIRSTKDVRGNVWLRPLHVIGGGGKGATYARSKEDVANWLRKHPKEIFTMNEYLPGTVYGLDTVWRRGELIGYLLKERITFGKSGASTSAVKVSCERAPIDIGIAAIKAIVTEPDGVFSVDMRENKKGIPCVTEINPGRFLTTSLLLLAETGHDLPSDVLSIMLGKKVSKRKPYTKEKFLYYVPGMTRLLDAKNMLIQKI